MARQSGTILPEEVVRPMLLNLRNRFTEVSAWHQRSSDLIATGRPVIKVPLPWGHYRILVGQNRSLPKLLNTQVQGRAAVGLKEALFEAEEDGLIHYIGGLVHDEIVATSVPNNEAKEYSEYLSAAMIRGMQKVCSNVPILVDADVGEVWTP